MKEDTPFPAKNIGKMQSYIVELNSILDFLLKLKYGQPIAITIDGATTTVSYDPKDSGQYDEIYRIVSGNYIKNMQNLSRYIYDLSQDKRFEEVAMTKSEV